MISATILLLLAHADAGIVAPGAKLERAATGYSFTEGPATDRKGNVYFTDQPNDRILRWSPDGKVTEWMKGTGRANGLTFDRKGNLIACADEFNQLVSISPDRKVTVLVKDISGSLLNGPNDAWVRPDGGIYFTDPLYARPYWKRDPKSQMTGQHVYFLDPKTKTLKPVATDLVQPNGIVGTPDGKILYVSDIGASKTYRYRINADGSLGDKNLVFNLGSDGMSLDDRGNVYLTGQGVTVFDSSGKQIQHIDVPENWTANVTFGGPDRKTLFITASKSVYTLQMLVRGND